MCVNCTFVVTLISLTLCYAPGGWKLFTANEVSVFWNDFLKPFSSQISRNFVSCMTGLLMKAVTWVTTLSLWQHWKYQMSCYKRWEYFG